MRYLRARTLAVLTLGFLTFVAGACGMDDAFAPGGVDSGAVPAPMATTTPPGIDPSDADAPDSFVPPVDAGPDANGPPSDPPIGVPDTFDASELDTERDIDHDRRHEAPRDRAAHLRPELVRRRVDPGRGPREHHLRAPRR